MKNIGWMLRQRATVSPRLQAYVEPSTDVRMTYAQMNALANRCADVLTALGIAKGDRVALLMPNSVEFCCLFYGAAKLGAVAVPINTRLAAPEVSFILSDSGSKVVIYGAPSAGDRRHQGAGRPSGHGHRLDRRRLVGRTPEVGGRRRAGGRMRRR